MEVVGCIDKTKIGIILVTHDNKPGNSQKAILRSRLGS